ncbi:MAG: hypothetical protein NW205_13710 [Hyphomicrobiaceae bacterium]|nr:hypothetical protein [Hyphomicrobiaceae bacterium]
MSVDRLQDLARALSTAAWFRDEGFTCLIVSESELIVSRREHVRGICRWVADAGGSGSGGTFRYHETSSGGVRLEAQQTAELVALLKPLLT